MSQKLDQLRETRARLEKQLDQLSNEFSIGNDNIAKMKAEARELLEKVMQLQATEFGNVLASDPRNQMANDLERVRKEYEGI